MTHRQLQWQMVTSVFHFHCIACYDVDTMVEMYERFLSELLDKHAPLKI